MNMRAVHLELAVDYSIVEFMQTLRQFFAIRGQPALMMSDNGSQLVGTECELREMIKGWNHKEQVQKEQNTSHLQSKKKKRK